MVVTFTFKLASSILFVSREAPQVGQHSVENARTKRPNASVPEVSAARKRDEWLLLERDGFRGKVIFSRGGDEGERKLRLIKIMSVSRDKLNHPLCSSANQNTKENYSGHIQELLLDSIIYC